MKKFLVAILMMAPLALNAQKFAHFNSADIIPNMKEYTTAQTEIQNMAKQFDDDLKLMQDELQKKTAGERTYSPRAGAQRSVPADAAVLPGQPAVTPEGTAGQDGCHPAAGARCSEEDR